MKPLSCLMASGLVVAAAVAAGLLPGSEAQPSDPGVRLCGRDFVRAVIISCGGSRWKRYSTEENAERRSIYSTLLDSLGDSLQDSPMGEPDIGEMEDTELETPIGESQQILPHSEGHGAPERSSEDWDEESGTRLPPVSLGALQEKPSRFKRGAGVARTCCKRGCTRSDIAKLC
uniref:relaxin-3-like n=1 Tax=Pristiophorus japonicus TaxID=55135 RepID=UPI00398E40C0